MVQTGALGLKKRKKKIYLFFLRKLPIIKSVMWHATSEQEKDDLIKVFGSHITEKIIIAQNISVPVSSESQPPVKTKNKANFTSVSLIVEMKNHIQFLKLLLISKPEWEINYNIYGPIKDQDYWERCLEIIKLLPNNIKVNYHGFLNPIELEKAYQENHFFVLPTKGENFGHAILEALTFGRPILLSDKTPWNDLDKKGSGWIFKNENEFYDIIEKCLEMENDEYNIMSKSALKHADQFLQSSNNIQAYSKLFD